jgi:hypothetical protein
MIRIIVGETLGIVLKKKKFHDTIPSDVTIKKKMTRFSGCIMWDKISSEIII